MHRMLSCLVALVLCLASARAQLPVREVTVFKDGHAFVLAEGSRPLKEGAVALDRLPVPVLGTFWPYAAQAGVTLVSATAGSQSLSSPRSVVALHEILTANIGKTVFIKELTGEPYSAKVLEVQAQAQGLTLLEVEKGIKALPTGRIQEVVLPSDAKRTLTETVRQNLLTLKLAGTSGASATVGVMYLQKGLRWIPSYKVAIDGKGQAQVKLQATLVNDLLDLDKTNVNLVIGVPTFAFQDTPDPISLQDTLAQVAANMGARSALMSNRFTNAQLVMGQQAGGYGESAPAEEGPRVAGGERNEDLFVFTVKEVTLKKGERMTLPIAEFMLPYTNVYTLELLPRPTVQNGGGGYSDQPLRPELAKLVAQPKAVHKIRLTNTSRFPLTTAPALVLSGDRVVAQGMMTYAAPGGRSDVSLTEAADITVKRTDTELTRQPNAIQHEGSAYFKVNMKGAVELRNFRPEPVELEVTRYVLGKVTEAESKGIVTALDPLGDDTLPEWLAQYGGIGDRLRFTGLGQVSWKVTLPPGQKTGTTLGYLWHYISRQ